MSEVQPGRKNRLEDPGSALAAGIEGGLVGVIASLGIPLLLWALDLDALLWLIPALGSLLFWPAAGGLAVIWLREKGSTNSADQLAAGIVAGLVSGIAAALALSTVSFLRMIFSQLLRMSGLLAGRSIDQVIVGVGILFGLPLLLGGVVFAGIGALVSAGWLRAPSKGPVLTESMLRRALMLTPTRNGGQQGANGLNGEAEPDKVAAPAELHETIAALESGQRESARAGIAEFLRKNPKDTQAWMWLAMAVDEHEQKIECLRRAISLDSENQRAQSMLRSLLGKPNGNPDLEAHEQQPDEDTRWSLWMQKVPRQANITLLFAIAAGEVLLLCLVVFFKLS